ncbi:uncharacterized protein V1518DRAFT_327494 [Limtongia smithiae]|uniref:uncharacterized protein n=1 Tax=Limtongia smithiae TaxID=1125753 RepID=UPI0034CF1E1F
MTGPIPNPGQRDKQQFDSLFAHTVDLTMLGKIGILYPWLCRTSDVECCLDGLLFMLANPRKSKAIIVVGKHKQHLAWVVDEIARRIALGQVSEPLWPYRVYAFNPAMYPELSTAGLQRLFTKVLIEIRNTGELCILFVKSIHLLWAYDTRDGKFSAVTLVDTVFAGSNLRCIFSTTPVGYESMLLDHSNRDRCGGGYFTPLDTFPSKIDIAPFNIAEAVKLYHMRLAKHMWETGISVANAQTAGMKLIMNRAGDVPHMHACVLHVLESEELEDKIARMEEWL